MKDSVKLTRFERLTLWNQYEVLKTLQPQVATEYEKMQAILENGYASKYHTLFDHIDAEELPIETASFVGNVLDMYGALQRVTERGLKTESYFERFVGFDGNEETEYMSYARHLVEVEKRFGYLNIQDFNSHMPTVRQYDKMLKVWSEVPSTRRHNLSESEARAILGA